MKRRRVKITGIGPVTPAGIGREEFWKGILEPVSRVRPFQGLDEKHGPFVAAYIDNFEVGKYADRTRVPRGASRQSLFAVAAAALALQDAGISAEEFGAANAIIVTGSSLLDFGAIGKSIESVSRRGIKGALPRTVFTANGTGSLDSINQSLGTSVPGTTLQSTCCSGIDSIGYAKNLVSTGVVDIALCGGTEAPLHQFPMIEFRAAGLTPATSEMPGRVSRPFDLWRTTGVVSEGAAMFVIEPETSRRPGFSFISGHAFANDESNELCGGLAKSARQALADAGRRPSDVDTINAWAPGHTLIDRGEFLALERVFGEALAAIPVGSLKGAIGTALGGAPAIQVAAVALAQRFGVLPPTVNWEYADPSCPLNLSNRSRSIEHAVTLINTHGVGSVNSSLILERC